MAAPKRITEASESRIITALGEVRAHMAGGDSPTEAVVKAASAHSVPAGHIRIMVNAVNNGLTNEKRTAADDLFKRAEEFPLADAGDILSRLYPEKVKSAAASRRETVVSDEYSRSPVWLTKAASVMEKRAYTIPPLTDRRAPENAKYADLPEVRIQKAHAEVGRAKYAAEVARGEAQLAYDTGVLKLAGLVDYFKSTASLPLAEVRYNAEALFGKQAALLLDKVQTYLPKSTREKRASSNLEPVDANAPPYALVRGAIAASNNYLTKRAKADEMYNIAAGVAETALSPFGLGPFSGKSVLAGLYSGANAEKVAGIFGDLTRGIGIGAGGSLMRGVGGNLPGAVKDTASLGAKDYLSLTDPEHESKIHNIRAEAMLNDLMANDEVIKGYAQNDPDEVLDAYNEVSQLSPRSATQKAVMRDLMRRRLTAGPDGLDLFTLDQSSNIENKLRQRDQPTPENLGILKDIGGLPKGSTGDAGDKGGGGEKKSSVLD